MNMWHTGGIINVLELMIANKFCFKSLIMMKVLNYLKLHLLRSCTIIYLSQNVANEHKFFGKCYCQNDVRLYKNRQSLLARKWDTCTKSPLPLILWPSVTGPSPHPDSIHPATTPCTRPCSTVQRPWGLLQCSSAHHPCRAQARG